MNTSEILALIRKDPFGLGEMPRDLTQYETRLIRAFEAGVTQGKKEAHELICRHANWVIFPETMGN